ncbi:MAG TPA: MarR family transcriptional regulator [Steroidobacteraceae bacterium]|nr:MarR family transcriptional regulator [Steroidobacteraceae bacterium]
MAASRQPASAARRENISRFADAKRRGDPEYPGFQLFDSPLYLIVRTAGRYAREFENALNASGMDLPSWRALMIVNEVSPSSVSEIAERSVTRLSTMTRVVQRLEKKRLVKLSKCRSDARVTEVHLTPLGKRCVERERGTAGKLYRRAMQDISSADIAFLNRLARRIFTNISGAAQESLEPSEDTGAIGFDEGEAIL